MIANAKTKFGCPTCTCAGEYTFMYAIRICTLSSGEGEGGVGEELSYGRAGTVVLVVPFRG